MRQAIENADFLVELRLVFLRRKKLPKSFLKLYPEFCHKRLLGGVSQIETNLLSRFHSFRNKNLYQLIER